MPESIRLSLDSKSKLGENGRTFTGSPQEKSKPAKKKDKDGIPLYQIQFDLIDWMTGADLPKALQGVQSFPFRFCTYYPDLKKRGIEVVLVTSDYTAVVSSEHEIYGKLTQEMRKFRGPALQYCIAYKQRKELVAAYIAEEHRYRLQKPPAVFCWQSEKKIAFNRVVDPAKDWQHLYGSEELRKVAPIYCDLIDRVDEKLAMRQFLGSLLHPESSHKQSLHLVGPGDAGKTTMLQVLLECFFGETGYASLVAKDVLKDAFIMDDCVNKMALFVDEINDVFYATEEFKQLTGGYKHRVNVKNKSAYSSNITAKLIATSNDIPSLPHDPAVTNRIVLIRIASLKEKERNRERFKARFLSEVPYILVDILAAFDLLKGKEIEISATAHDESLEIGSAHMQVFFDQYFRHKPGSKTLAVSEFKRRVVEYGHGRVNYKKFRQFLTYRYGARFDVVSPSSVRVVSDIIESVKLG